MKKTFIFMTLIFTSAAAVLENNVTAEFTRSFVKPDIVGGSDATPGQFPFQAHIQILGYMGGYQHQCSGVIYDERHIITAAHCVRGYHPNNILITAGDHNLVEDEGTEQVRYIDSYVIHPGYNPNSFDNDLAIVFLDSPLHYNNRVRPIPVLQDYFEGEGPAITIGWGNSETPQLQFVELNVVDRETCQSLYRPYPVTNSMMCAGHLDGGKGSCNGDSGGPLICTSKLGLEYLCGIVSWGMIPCGQAHYPTVFANVVYFQDWFLNMVPPQFSLMN